jgi:hypothetical protein
MKNIQIGCMLTLVVVLTTDSCWCKNPKASSASTFTISGDKENKEIFLGKNPESLQVFLNVVPHGELDQEMGFKITSWRVLQGMKGKLKSESGEEVGVDFQLKRGENLFQYTPLTCWPSHTFLGGKRYEWAY